MRKKKVIIIKRDTQVHQYTYKIRQRKSEWYTYTNQQNQGDYQLPPMSVTHNTVLTTRIVCRCTCVGVDNGNVRWLWRCHSFTHASTHVAAASKARAHVWACELAALCGDNRVADDAVTAQWNSWNLMAVPTIPPLVPDTNAAFRHPCVAFFFFFLKLYLPSVAAARVVETLFILFYFFLQNETVQSVDARRDLFVVFELLLREFFVLLVVQFGWRLNWISTVLKLQCTIRGLHFVPQSSQWRAKERFRTASCHPTFCDTFFFLLNNFFTYK